MKFWLPLTIFLTMVSPNLEAETIDPLSVPWNFNVRLFNVDSGLARTDWSETLIHFEEIIPQSNGLGLIGIFEFKANGEPFSTPSFEGLIGLDNSLVIVTTFPGIETLFRGSISEDFMSMGGRLDGLGTSDMTGLWAASPVELPAAGFLLVCAVGSIFFFSRKPV